MFVLCNCFFCKLVKPSAVYNNPCGQQIHACMRTLIKQSSGQALNKYAGERLRRTPPIQPIPSTAATCGTADCSVAMCSVLIPIICGGVLPTQSTSRHALSANCAGGSAGSSFRAGSAEMIMVLGGHDGRLACGFNSSLSWRT